MSTPKFIDELPPRAARGRTLRADPIFDALRQNPGRWAEIGSYSVADRLKASQRAAYVKKQAGIEATTRTVDGRVLVFARATVTGGAEQ